MRRRNFDVIAKPRILTGSDNVSNNWRFIFKNAQWNSCSKGNGKEQVEEYLTKYGDGARAEIYVVWKRRSSSHVFVEENINGEVKFNDPQNGCTNVSYYFDDVKAKRTEICRIDNLEPSQLILDCCEAKKE